MDVTAEYYKKVLDNLYDGIYFIDKDKKILYWNKGAEEHTGYRQSDVIGKKCFEILKHADKKGVKLCEEKCPVSRTMVDCCLREVDVYLHHKEGHLVPVSMRIAQMQDQNDQIVVAVEIYNEKSPRFRLHREIEELRSLALIDPLTELGNRRYITTNLRGKLDEFNRYGLSFGVLFLDIDHFKKVNDNYGHDTGDKILKMISKTVSNSLRSFDIFGRWGGEEFVAILANVNEDQLYPISDRLRLLVEQSNIFVGPDIVRMTVSIGATLAQRNDDINTIIQRADELMYNSKVSGRNCISIHTDFSLRCKA